MTCCPNVYQHAYATSVAYEQIVAYFDKKVNRYYTFSFVFNALLFFWGGTKSPARQKWQCGAVFGLRVTLFPGSAGQAELRCIRLTMFFAAASRVRHSSLTRDCF